MEPLRLQRMAWRSSPLVLLRDLVLICGFNLEYSRNQPFYFVNGVFNISLFDSCCACFVQLGIYGHFAQMLDDSHGVCEGCQQLLLYNLV